MHVDVAGILGVAKKLFCPEYVHNKQDPEYFTPSGDIGIELRLRTACRKPELAYEPRFPEDESVNCVSDVKQQ